MWYIPSSAGRQHSWGISSSVVLVSVDSIPHDVMKQKVGSRNQKSWHAVGPVQPYRISVNHNAFFFPFETS
jgi:hypothetical protein